VLVLVEVLVLVLVLVEVLVFVFVVVLVEVLASQFSVPAVQVPVACAEIFGVYAMAINKSANAIDSRMYEFMYICSFPI
jgi:hypothetical protein